ncbi:hypothetical protein ABBQ38_007954 [Trebouxia sp. C0009 RCD-2024]
MQLSPNMKNFSVVMNQHSPVSDSAAHFLVTLKRPEQRQLDQQRKANSLQQPVTMGGPQGQQPAHQAAHQASHQGSHQQGPHRRQQSLTGAAYPWAGMPHPPVSPQMQQAWNAAQEPHMMQGHVGKRPASMWGAVPQHPLAVPPAQAQHSQAQAHAQQFALAQAAAQAQAMLHIEVPPPPPPPPNPHMGSFGHASHAQAAHAHASAAFQAAQQAEYAQQAQHGQGYMVPPPPPPTSPGFGSGPRGSFGPIGHNENWHRGKCPSSCFSSNQPSG